MKERIQFLAVAVCTVILPFAVFMRAGATAAPVALTASTELVAVDATTKAVVSPAGRQMVQTFTAATKAATVPVAAGQIGWETDTGGIYRATAGTAGSWSAVTTGGGGSVEAATTSAAGIVELATSAEVAALTDTSRAVTPSGLAGILSDADSSARLVSNGAGGFRLELWNADQGGYQEVRLAGAVGEERVVIGAAE